LLDAGALFIRNFSPMFLPFNIGKFWLLIIILIFHTPSVCSRRNVEMFSVIRVKFSPLIESITFAVTKANNLTVVSVHFENGISLYIITQLKVFLHEIFWRLDLIILSKYKCRK